MDAIIGTILILLFDLIVIIGCVAWIIYTPISWIIPVAILLGLAFAMYKPHKDVIGWWTNKLK